MSLVNSRALTPVSLAGTGESRPGKRAGLPQQARNQAMRRRTNPNEPTVANPIGMNKMPAKFGKQTQRCYPTLYQWVRGILGPKFAKYEWNYPALLRIQVKSGSGALDRAVGDGEITLTTEATMCPEIKRLGKCSARYCGFGKTPGKFPASLAAWRWRTGECPRRKPRCPLR